MDSAAPPSHGGGGNAVRAVIMAVLVAVFTGYLFLWIMMPTNPYRLAWLPELRKETASTYFGNNQGATYLVYTFPMLFIAALGCVYLHLGKKSREIHTNRSKGGHKMAVWKRPLIIKGLGIVSRIELAFFLMFMALLVWNFANYLSISFAKLHLCLQPKVEKKCK